MPYYKYRPIKQHGRYNTQRFKQIYEEKLKEKFPALLVPQALKDSGVILEDPNHPDFPHATCPFKPKLKHEIPTQNLFHGFPEEENAPVTQWDPADPMYKPTASYCYDGSDPLTENVKQTGVIFKAILRRGLPSSLLDRVKDVVIPDEESRMHRFLMLSQQWDATRQKLPKRIDPEFPYWNFTRYWGIPDERKNAVLLDNMFHYCSLNSAQLPGFFDLQPVRDGQSNVLFNRANTLIRVESVAHLVRLSPRLGPAIASPEDVLATQDEPIPDIFPISAVIDLRKEHAYDDQLFYPLSNLSFVQPSFVNLVIVNRKHDYKYPMSPSEETANLCMQTAASALAVAQRKSMTSDQLREAPIVTCGIQCNRNLFDFVVFQLNTLDLDNDEGVKNMIWHEGELPMFRLNDFWLDFEGVEDYDHGVFRKFLALYMYGFH